MSSRTGTDPKCHLRALALASYPTDAAATRLRIAQLIEPLAGHGIEVDLRPFIDPKTFAALYDRSRWYHTAAGVFRGIGRRLAEVVRAKRYDVLILQREAALLGPPITEWLLGSLWRLPIVLDLDDPTWVAYNSPTYGRLSRILRPPGKADWLIRHADFVTCGSTAVAKHVEDLGTPAITLPTVVDLNLFRPRPGDRRRSGRLPVVGWIGSHSTWQYVEPLLPVLARVASQHKFRLLIVGHGSAPVVMPGHNVETRHWSLEREVEDFTSLDIGLYPITDGLWAAGKSGLKAVQYMSVGVPFVASPIGEVAVMGKPGTTHFLASSPDEWHEALSLLLADETRRSEMGREGRVYAETHFGTETAANGLARAVYRAIERRSIAS